MFCCFIGAATKGRKWIEYEIKKTWDEKKGLVGIYIHNLKDSGEKQSAKGGNPFDGFTVGQQKTPLSTIVKAYDPPFKTSTDVYDHISNNLESWIEEAVKIRSNY